MQKQKWIVLCIGTAASAWAMVALLALYQFSVPNFFDATHTADNRTESFVMPLHVINDTKFTTVEMKVALSPLHPTVYRLIPDDCVHELWINDVLVEDERAKFCDLKGRDIYLGEYLHAGENHLKVVLQDFGGFASLRVRVGASDPMFLIVRFLLVFVPALYGLLVLRVFGVKKNIYVLFGIAVAGSMFAKYYDFHIPYYSFSYDADGHIEYVKYVATHWSVPPAQGFGARGWEFYQPPLYYFLLALWTQFGEMLGRPASLLLEDMETISWMLMTFSLFLTAWLGTLLFPRKSEQQYQYIFLAFVAFMPITLFQASRITNDVLFYVFTLLVLGFLLRWWRFGLWRDWYLTILMIGLGLLVKSNAIPLLVAAFFCLLLKPRVSFGKKIGVGAVSLLLVALIVGWYQYQRFVVEGESGLVGNLGGLSIAMLVPNGPANYLVFNPFKVLDIPFNNVWSDAHRRQYFWEYFIRSMHFGEFDFGHGLRSMATLLLMVTLPIIAMSIVGLLGDMRKILKGFVPVWAVGGALGAAALGYRITAPYSCNQDFRFIAPVIVVLAFYMILGIRMLPKWAQSALLQITGACVVVSVMFVFLLVQ